MNTKRDKLVKDIIFKLSAILILASTIVFFFYPPIASYIMAVGIVGYTVSMFTTPYPGKSIRGKRLYNMHVFGLMFMIVAAYLMFNNKTEWVMMILISAFLIGYSTIVQHKVYADELEKEKNDKDK